MKKLLLSVGALALIGGANAAGPQTPLVNNTKAKAVKFQKNLTKDEFVAPGKLVAARNSHPSNNHVSSIGTQIGATSYGLQSNGAIGRRIINYGGGVVSAVWTTANAGEDANFQSRGTGYNYFDGTNWLKAGSTNYGRIENVRTGFTNILALPNNMEMTVAHTPSSGFAFASSAKGSGTWTTSIKPEATMTLAGGSAPYPFWSRAAVNKTANTIHLVSCYSDTLQKYTVGGVTYNRPVIYSRSKDGGATWDKTGTILPGYGDYFGTGVADNYSIDADDNGNVAILYGNNGESLVLWKSTDNGETFTTFVIDAVEKNLEASLDTVFTSDGSGSVVLDNNGKAHVAFTGCRVAGDGVADGSFSFYPGEIHLIYWNEVDQKEKELMITDSMLTGDPTVPYTVGTNTATSPTSGGARYGNDAMLCKPSIAVDENGIVYIACSLPGFEAVDANDNSFRDIWLTRSTDAATSATNYVVNHFTALTNLTATSGNEEAFATIAKNTSDGKIHMVFQSDDTPGVNYSGSNVAPEASAIYYTSIDRNSSLLAGSYPVLSAVGISDIASNANFKVSQNMPNPFGTSTLIGVSSDKATKASFEVRNMLGQSIFTKTVDVAAGLNTIEVNKSDLNGAGVYFYTVRVGKNIVTKKMIVE